MDRRELLKRLGGLGLLLGGGKALASEPKALEMGVYPPEPALPVELEELAERPVGFTSGWCSGPGTWSSLALPGLPSRIPRQPAVPLTAGKARRLRRR